MRARKAPIPLKPRAAATADRNILKASANEAVHEQGLGLLFLRQNDYLLLRCRGGGIFEQIIAAAILDSPNGLLW